MQQSSTAQCALPPPWTSAAQSWAMAQACTRIRCWWSGACTAVRPAALTRHATVMCTVATQRVSAALCLMALYGCRRQVLLACQSLAEVHTAMSDISQLQAVPLLQAVLFQG